MEEMLARCGMRCDMCLAYRPSVEANPSDQQVLSDAWHKYFGFRIPAEDILCDGCMADNPQLIDKECPVRPCVIERALQNCAQCPDYGCEKLGQRTVSYESVAARIEAPIPEKDRARFIEPYENKARLDEILARRGS